MPGVQRRDLLRLCNMACLEAFQGLLRGLSGPSICCSLCTFHNVGRWVRLGDNSVHCLDDACLGCSK